MSEFVKTRARDEILFHVLQFSVAHNYGGNVGAVGHGPCFTPSDVKRVTVGDLVLLKSIRKLKWSLAWLHDISGTFDSEYLCESIETGEMCWWSNVGIEFYDREAVSNSPQWRWTDRQHSFNDRWKKVCYKKHDAYTTIPKQAMFGDNYSVTLSTRTRFLMDDYSPSKEFPDWRKVTKQMMSEFYLECKQNKSNEDNDAD